VSVPESEKAAKKGLTPEAADDIAVVAKGGAIQVVGQISQRGLSFVFGVVFNLLLSPAAYGLYKLVSQILLNLSQLGLAGFNYATMRWVARSRASKDPGGVRGALRVGVTGSLIASALVVVALLVFTEPVARFFADDAEQLENLNDLLRIGAAYIPLFAMLQVLRYATQGYKTMIPSVMVGNIIQPITRTVLGGAALVLGFGVTGAVTSLVVSVAVSVAVAIWYVRRLLTPKQRAAKPTPQVGPMVRFALPQAGASLLGVQTLGIGTLLLGRFDTTFAVGIFAIALSLQGPANVFLGGIVNIWAPVVSDLHGRGEIARLGSLYQVINRWIATFSFPVLAALIVMPEVFVWFFGDKADAAAPVAAILAIGNIFYSGTGPTGYLISMTGHPGINFVNSAVSVALYIGLGMWVVPEHGVIGMAWVDAGVTALVNSVRVIQAKMLVGIQPYGRTFYKPVVATLGAAGALLAWKQFSGDSVGVQAVGLAVGVVVYLGLLKLLGIDEEEREVFTRIRKRALKRGRG
jgi:O-antigen/teichoic acid export membrane protein